MRVALFEPISEVVDVPNDPEDTVGTTTWLLGALDKSFVMVSKYNMLNG